MTATAATAGATEPGGKPEKKRVGRPCVRQKQCRTVANVLLKDHTRPNDVVAVACGCAVDLVASVRRILVRQGRIPKTRRRKKGQSASPAGAGGGAVWGAADVANEMTVVTNWLRDRRSAWPPELQGEFCERLLDNLHRITDPPGSPARG